MSVDASRTGGGPEDIGANRGVEAGWVGVEVDAERVALETEAGVVFFGDIGSVKRF